MSDTINTEAVRATLDAATPGPWDVRNGTQARPVEVAGCLLAHFSKDARGAAHREANTSLIEMAPALATAYLAQVEEIERLRKRVEAADRLAELAWYSSDETLRPHVLTYRATEKET